MARSNDWRTEFCGQGLHLSREDWALAVLACSGCVDQPPLILSVGEIGELARREGWSPDRFAAALGEAHRQGWLSELVWSERGELRCVLTVPE